MPPRTRSFVALLAALLALGCRATPAAPVDATAPGDVPDTSVTDDLHDATPDLRDAAIDTRPDGPFRLEPPTLCVGSSCPSLAAGEAHTCVSRSETLCVGRNTSGQLGDGTTTNRTLYVRVEGLGAAPLSAGRAHTCGIAPLGSVQCWGDNSLGQLGRAPGGLATTPMLPIPTVSMAVQIASGSDHTCALSGDGRVRCWGDNAHGQLGVATAAPGAVVTLDLTDVAGITAGAAHTCALTLDGLVRCWGDNAYGQLGDGTTTARFTPMLPIPTLSRVVKIAAGGRHTCALDDGGAVRCWGDNARGQLGDGTTSARYTPMLPIPTISDATTLVGGDAHTCSLSRDGVLRCWGDNASGQIGAESPLSPTPVVLAGLSGAQAIALGKRHTCALLPDGEVSCLGDNADGQLGGPACGAGMFQCGRACVDVRSDSANCGACGRVCSAPMSESRCVMGACAVVGCTTPFRNCDGAAANGCETNTLLSPVNCGTCGNACAAGQLCISGVCNSAMCPSGQIVCDGACIDPMTDPNHCGRCGRMCLPMEVCSFSVCGTMGITEDTPPPFDLAPPRD